MYLFHIVLSLPLGIRVPGLIIYLTFGEGRLLVFDHILFIKNDSIIFPFNSFCREKKNHFPLFLVFFLKQFIDSKTVWKRDKKQSFKIHTLGNLNQYNVMIKSKGSDCLGLKISILSLQLIQQTTCLDLIRFQFPLK